ncbi:MAG: cell wall hydrolase [Rubricoccaceae bacterium]|nr:cell wall hydrolase [Rubricoccaceae bacterium]
MVFATVLAFMLLALAMVFPTMDRAALQEGWTPVALVEHEAPTFDPATVSEDVLWLARCIYSETKRPAEQELVAWVVRNRVETGYRGEHTYRDVVLDPFQFSAFNPGSTKRRLYTTLDGASTSRGWHRALEIAHEVYHAPGRERPFPVQTRHFYSERSMVGGATPDWAKGKTPVRLTGTDVDPKRFRFYASIA